MNGQENRCSGYLQERRLEIKIIFQTLLSGLALHMEADGKIRQTNYTRKEFTDKTISGPGGGCQLQVPFLQALWMSERGYKTMKMVYDELPSPLQKSQPFTKAAEVRRGMSRG